MDRFDAFLSELIPAGVALRLLANLTLSALAVVPVSLVFVLFLRRASASARHFVVSLAFVGLLAVPVLSFLLPANPDSGFVDTILITAQTQAERLGEGAKLETSAGTDPLPKPSQPQLRIDELELASESETPPSERLTPAKAMNASVTRHKEPYAAEAVSAGWLDGATMRQVELFVTVLWGAGVLLLVVRVLGGQVILLRMLRSGRQISDSHLAGIARDALSAVGLQRSVALIESDRCSMPMTCRWLRPAVVLPTAAREWSADRLRMVLLHELAHVRRRDCLWQWLVFVVTACHWFNPLVWLAAARLRNEQEQACDDAVLITGVRASDYAETLVDISTGGRPNLFALCSGIAMARSDRLSSRVRAIVDEQRDRQAVSRGACVVASLVAMLLVVPLSQLAQADFRVGSESAPRNDGQKPPEAPATRDAAALEEVDADKARVSMGTIKEIASAIAAVFPDWTLHQVDAKPQALADGYRGFRIVLRRNWKEYTGPPQQQARAQPAGESAGPFEERHEDWEFVLVPVQPAKAPESFKSRIKWQASTSPYHTRDICLGEGHGYMWFTHGTIPLQHGVRKKLELKGGDDPIQLAVDGLLIEDTGSNTANSAPLLLALHGDRALPYIERAIQKAQQAGDDPWKAVVSLNQIQTPRATDMLIRLFESGDDKLRRPAGYALIHKPYRKSAKRAYLAMLRDRVSVERVAEACAEFEWREAIPILQNLIDKPNNLREFQYALHARRSLEGRPIAQELLDAEQTLLRSLMRENVDPRRDQQIASARQLLIESEDSEAANLAALSLAVFVTKGDVSKVREAGIEILRLRPREETLKFLQSLATGIHEDKRVQIEKVLRTVSN